MDKVRILVADDSAGMRELYRKLLETKDNFEVVGMAEDGEEAVDKALKLVPDVVILDVNMPKADGIEASRHIARNHPGIGIIVISAEDDLSFVTTLMKDEPDHKAYVLKSSLSDIAEFTRVVDAVASGRTVLDPEIAQKMVRLHNKQTTSQANRLTEVGEAVLELILEGFDDSSITQTLGLNRETMEDFVDSICGNLGLINDSGRCRGALAVGALINSNGY